MLVNIVVLDVLKNAEKPLRIGEIAEIVSLDRKEVDKAIKILKNEGTIISPKRCYYTVH